jgi:putative transposase
MSASARGTRACPGKRVRQKAGRTLVQVGRFYPSSKTCSGCGAEHDRDENAARNIEREGLRLLEHP